MRVSKEYVMRIIATGNILQDFQTVHAHRHAPKTLDFIKTLENSKHHSMNDRCYNKNLGMRYITFKL